MGVFSLLALISIWIHLFSTLREKHTILPVLDRWVRLWQNVTFPIRRATKGFLQKCLKGMNVSGTVLGWKESIRHGGYLALKNVRDINLNIKCSTGSVQCCSQVLCYSVLAKGNWITHGAGVAENTDVLPVGPALRPRKPQQISYDWQFPLLLLPRVVGSESRITPVAQNLLE